MKKQLKVSKVTKEKEVTTYELSKYNFKGTTALGTKLVIMEDSEIEDPLELEVGEELGFVLESGYVEFNMNNYVKFKLEDYGKKVWLEHYADLDIEYKLPECDDEGFYKLQAWQYCQIFGKHMGNGFENPTNLNVMFQVKI